ncbi:hypothetical protein FOCG_18549 [Fusarium oxysporum f. sp. radicis-lycopersici 26381]|nr:hypothetical protein FOCG_18549 [Fusarium oxysporum f. sp. radicis-lycopersici 26381]
MLCAHTVSGISSPSRGPSATSLLASSRSLSCLQLGCQIRCSLAISSAYKVFGLLR